MMGFWGCPATGSHGLPTTPPLTTADPIAEADLRAADHAAEEGRAADAERLYRAFLERHPGDPVAPLATLGLGRTLLVQGRGEDALMQFERARSASDSVVAERARFHQGIALHLLGRHSEALTLLTPLRGRLVDPADNALLLRSIAAASLAVGQVVPALRALDELARTQGAEADAREARERLLTVADRELSADQVEVAYRELDREGLAWPRVALRALRAAYDRADVARVREIAAEVRERGVELDSDIAALVLRADRITTADPRVIGAILPLTGRGRDVGQSALRGLMLAAGLPPSGPTSPDAPQLVFRDDMGDPERAARAVEELVSVHRAIAIIGPLEGAAAQAAATRALALGVPLVTLSPSDAALATGPTSFRMFPSPRGELRALLEGARSRGALRIGVIRPENGYGEAIRAACASEVGSGQTVVADVHYAPGATSFQAQATELANARVDAVVIADSGRQVALIAPALAAAGLSSGRPSDPAPSRGRKIALLLPSAAFDARLPTTAGRYLEGAIFSVPFHATTSEGEGRTFTDAFMRRWSAEPDTFAAYSYDAFNLVWRTVRAGANTRETLDRALIEGPRAATAGASQGLGAGRDARSATRLFEMRANLFVPLTR
jgi:branched-chain amino acid transport system substrate-binding protein